MDHRISRNCRDGLHTVACAGCSCACHGVPEPQQGFPSLFAEARAKARAATAHWRAADDDLVAAAHAETDRLSA